MTDTFKVKSYDDLNSYSRNSFSFLEQKEPLNSIFWDITKRYLVGDKRVASGNVFQKSDIKLSFLKLESNYILLSTGSRSALHSLVAYAKKKKWKICGVLGTDQLTDIFSKLWEKNSEVNLQRGKKLFHIFETRGFSKKNIINSSYQMVQAKDYDWPRVRLWANHFAKEADYTLSPYNTITFAREMMEGDGVYLLKKNNHSLAMAGFGRRTSNRLVINMVYVPRENRGNGFAQNIILQMSRKAQDMGFCRCILFSEQNLERNLYKKMGCRLVGDFSEVSF